MMGKFHNIMTIFSIVLCISAATFLSSNGKPDSGMLIWSVMFLTVSFVVEYMEIKRAYADA